MAGTAMKDSDADPQHPLTLFGGDSGWHSSDWTASDDRVRGGKSQSYLDCGEKFARFHGTLDIQTLGGAGFASQRTTGDDRQWDLSQYAGIQLNIAKGDKKRYTFILKDELLPVNEENGREQSTISWECDFELPPQAEPGDTSDRSVFIPWKSLNPTYRGKLKKDADPLDTKSVKRMSIMMRSFFGTQEGDFSLSIRSITALPKAPPPTSKQAGRNTVDPGQLEDGTAFRSANDNANAAQFYQFRINAGGINMDLQIQRKTVLLLVGISAAFIGYCVVQTWRRC